MEQQQGNQLFTKTGKQKFMPPSQRKLLEIQQQQDQQKFTQQMQYYQHQDNIQNNQNENDENQYEKGQNKFNNFNQAHQKKKFHAEKIHLSVFQRNQKMYQCPNWGHLYNRNGQIDQKMYNEEEAYFEEQQRILQYNKPNVDNYQNLELIVEKSKLNKPEVSEIDHYPDNFNEVKIHEALLNNIQKCSYQKCTIIQKHVIPWMLQSINVMACSQTGSGKTAAFLIPTIQKMILHGPTQNLVKFTENKMQTLVVFPVALVLAPTRELSMQIYQEARKLCSCIGIIPKVAYGGTDYQIQLQSVLRFGCDIIICTPGRLIDYIENNEIQMRCLKYIVLDEADRMLDMGFEPQIMKILDYAYQQSIEPEKEISMFSATFPQGVKQIAHKYIKDYIYVSVGGQQGSVNECIKQEIIYVEEKDKLQKLYELTINSDGKIMVFCDKKIMVDEVFNFLDSKNVFCVSIHGDKSQKQREKALSIYKKQNCKVIIATDVASRGLDLPKIEYVINFNLPTNIEDYIHRIGRTGRMGREGVAISFINDYNKPIFQSLKKLLIETKNQVPEWLDKQTKTYYADKQINKYSQQRSYNNYNNNYNNKNQQFRRNNNNQMGGGQGGYQQQGPQFKNNNYYQSQQQQQNYQQYPQQQQQQQQQSYQFQNKNYSSEQQQPQQQQQQQQQNHQYQQQYKKYNQYNNNNNKEGQFQMHGHSQQQQQQQQQPQQQQHGGGSGSGQQQQQYGGFRKGGPQGYDNYSYANNNYNKSKNYSNYENAYYGYNQSDLYQNEIEDDQEGQYDDYDYDENEDYYYEEQTSQQQQSQSQQSQQQQQQQQQQQNK